MDISTDFPRKSAIMDVQHNLSRNQIALASGYYRATGQYGNYLIEVIRENNRWWYRFEDSSKLHEIIITDVSALKFEFQYHFVECVKVIRSQVV